ncbi:MAG: hypothetical protein IPK22_13010 [Verrucomicrobiaceae bacterium]|nr:hypothetical protein [Verrucomicrobiaceae bacterium]
MAFRLDQAIVRGELDNTEQGHLRGRIWLEGREQPLTLDLEGDAWRDVAGARITFTNPEPRRQKNQGDLKPVQHGIVGDITVSKKVKQITASDEEWQRCMEDGKQPTFEWRNSLYIEWFSEENGRVVIESADFELQITEFTWQMDEAEEQAQQFANLNAMRNWLATIIQRPEKKDDDDDDGFDEDEDLPVSEAEWEESLKLSDRLTDAHMEAMDKYADDDDDETKVAFVMGWDHMLDMMAQAQENSGKPQNADNIPSMEDFEDDDDPEDAGEEWKEDADDASDDDAEDDDDAFADYMEERRSHPLQKTAHKLVTRILRDLRDEDRDEGIESEEARNTPLSRFISNTMSISGKLAGALSTRRFAEGSDAGYTLAILKRCLNWANEALSGLNELLADSLWEDRHTLFSEYKRELHVVRDGITDLRQEIRLKNPGI